MNGNYLQALNEQQRAAVEHIQGPSFIIAGAGSGKTRVLTSRIAYMLEHGVTPSQILALTFTNKAAKEMKERVALQVGQDCVRYLWMGTFHSVFAKILRYEAPRIGFASNFTIYDQTDAKNLIKSCIKELQLDEKYYPAHDVLGRISMAKNNLCSAQAYAGDVRAQEVDRAANKPRLHEIYTLYAAKCKRAGAMDFDDLLLYTNILLSQNPDVLDKYRARFQYILVDEYQDTNLAQYLIIKNLAIVHRNIAVVGDDAQSIYAFRGARIENIGAFKVDFPEHCIYKLERNYRSTQTVVDAANCLIKNNPNQEKKACFSLAPVGEKIELLRALTDGEEAYLVVASLLSRMYRDKAVHSDFAILYRTNLQARMLEEALRKRNIPYKVYGGLSFYDRAEVKDVMMYLRLVVNPRDDEAFRRVVNVPARGIGATSMAKLTAAAMAQGVSCMEFIESGPMEAAGLHASAPKLTAFAQLIRKAQALQQEGKNAFEIAMEVVNTSTYLSSLKQDTSIEGKGRLDNVEALLNSIQSFCSAPQDDNELETEVAAAEGDEAQPTLERFLMNAALLSQLDQSQEDDNDRVSLMTVHSAKGLEFPYVYVTGMEEQLFPLVNLLSSPLELEEERRLFYVAMTRAKIGLTLSYAQSRMRWGSITNYPPSRFLKEIDARFLDKPLRAEGTPHFSKAAPWSSTASSRPGASSAAPSRPSPSSAAPSRPSPSSRPATPYRSGASTQQPASPRPTAPQPPAVPSHLVSLSAAGASARSGASSAPASGASSMDSFITGGPDAVQVGMRVEHPSFGVGRVLTVEGRWPDTKAVIDFDGGGTKTLLLKFAKLKAVQE